MKTQCLEGSTIDYEVSGLCLTHYRVFFFDACDNQHPRPIRSRVEPDHDSYASENEYESAYDIDESGEIGCVTHMLELSYLTACTVAGNEDYRYVLVRNALSVSLNIYFSEESYISSQGSFICTFVHL